MRYVHYAAFGRKGMAFDCFIEEQKIYFEDEKANMPPKRHTDLRKVTCQNCWSEIYHMAKDRLGIVKV